MVAVIVGSSYFAYDQGIPMNSYSQKISQIQIGDTIVQVDVADTDSTREQGLSGRDPLPPGRGMLFVFDSPMIPGFWMKDMRFALDMLFIDPLGKIVTIDRNLLPSTYLQSPPEVFRPSAPVMYVLEVPAGFAKAHGIVEGMRVVLQ